MEVRGDTLAVYVHKVAAGYLQALDRFDDDSVNRKPHGDGTNSGVVLVTHAWASARFWIDHVGLGRHSDRVRDDEFAAVATVDDLRLLVRSSADDLARSVLEYDAGPTGTVHESRTRLADEDGDGSDGSLVIHALEELFQHLGHLELTADALATTP